MKKFYYNIIGLFVLIILLPTSVNANIICNDGTVSPSCKDCHRGCCSHHGGCTNGGGNTNNYANNNSSSSNSDYNTQHPTIKEEIKSNDVSLKRVTVDYENIAISDNMTYLTTKESVRIYAATNDDKAIVEYNNSADLMVGENIVNLKVIAENGNVKEYKLNIIRERVLSNNKNIKIMIDGKVVVFNSFKSDTIYLSNSESKLDLKYELEDKNATAEIIGNKNLKVGKNEVIVKVTAENGEKQNYIIIIEKYNKIEETITNIVTTILTFGFFGAIGYSVHYSINRKKKS